MGWLMEQRAGSGYYKLIKKICGCKFTTYHIYISPIPNFPPKTIYSFIINHFTMAHSKADQFDRITFNQATWCRIQAHPARIIILNHLNENGPSCFHDFQQKIFLHHTTISQHIRYLLRHRVITIKEKYPKAIYQIESSLCGKLASLLTELQYGFSNN